MVGCTEPIRNITVMKDGKQLTTDGRPVTMNTKTCKNPIHVKMEHLNKEQSKVNFQLSQKLMHQKVTHPNNAMPQDKATSSLADLEDTEEWFTIDPVTKNVCMYTINNPSAAGELDPSIALIMDPCMLLEIINLRLCLAIARPIMNR